MSKIKATSSLFGLLMVVVSMAFFYKSSEATAILQKFHVYIINDLDEGMDLMTHCRSKDDDLGLHTLAKGQNFTWDFHVNFWGTTLFYCEFQWGNNVHGTFDVFETIRDGGRCLNICYWYVRTDGLHFTNNIKDPDPELDYRWP
ncbi:S-protein homolog 6-like [Telopea speciosissima]|uniref:S-protein homolog 6-like n=1 Tax=Telopea speciosissima TaxID=54955 RepID=UPI001CC78BB8|nr:S-protein homolog 6-like [Telopea speciosissima]